MSSFLFTSLRQSADRFPERLALVFNDSESCTYTGLLQETAKCAAFLKREGLKQGDLIYAALGSTMNFCALIYAANYLGITVIPVSTKLKDDGIAHLLSSIAPKAVFYDAERQPFFPQLAAKTVNSAVKCYAASELDFSKEQPLSLTHPAEAADPAFIMFTSGTTGAPKGAVISNLNVEAAVKAYKDALGLTAEDRTVLGVPIFHITGLIAILAFFIYLGGTIYVEARFKARRVLDLIAEHQITFLHGSPTVFSLLHEECDKSGGQRIFPSLKSIACGAGRLNLGTVRALKRMFPNAAVHSIYGLTESTSPFTLYRGDLSATDSCESSGTPCRGCSVQIRDEDRHLLPPGSVGNIWIKGPNVIKSYYPVPEHPEKYFDGDYFFTGDIGLIRPDGHLVVKDRVKDIINRGGEKITCPDVESLISTWDQVLEVALVAKPDPLYGEVPVAFIRTETGRMIDTAALTDFLAKHLPKFMLPADYILIKDFPRTHNGKINKCRLRERFSNEVRS